MLWIIQNQANVPAGHYSTLAEDLNQSHRIVALYQKAPLPRLEKGDKVLLLGGTMSYNEIERYPWLISLKNCLQEAAESGIPLLCICLGAQLLADALGGTVTRNFNQERGISRIHLTNAGRSDQLMAEIPTTFPAMQWHNDSFALPPQATLLATSATCPVQVFRYQHAYGIQFHPEVTQYIVKTWNATLDPPGHFAEEFAFARPDWQPVWDRLFLNFIAIDS